MSGYCSTCGETGGCDCNAMPPPTLKAIVTDAMIEAGRRQPGAWGYSDDLLIGIYTAMHAASPNPEASDAGAYLDAAMLRDKVIAEAADALDIADNIILINMGTDTPKEWHQAFRRVAKARARLEALSSICSGEKEGG